MLRILLLLRRVVFLLVQSATPAGESPEPLFRGLSDLEIVSGVLLGEEEWWGKNVEDVEEEMVVEET